MRAEAPCSHNLKQRALVQPRDALLRQAGGPEEFLAMRASYAASLAAVSVTGYITGAGDRHLENFLMHTASGTLIPIDFGYDASAPGPHTSSTSGSHQFRLC